MIERYDAILFDMGYTLLAPHPSFEQLVVDTAATHDVALTTEGVREADPQAFRQAHQRAVDRCGRDGNMVGQFTLSRQISVDFWCDFYDTLLRCAGVAVPPPALPQALYDTFTSHESYAFYDDVFPVLDTLRARGLRLGVVSNWEAWLHEFLGARGVSDKFSCIIVSGAVGIEKPHPGIFQLAFEALDVLPQRCMYVGDSIEYDVTPARTLGVEPVLIDRRGRLDERDVPCRSIRSLFELL